MIWGVFPYFWKHTLTLVSNLCMLMFRARNERSWNIGLGRFIRSPWSLWSTFFDSQRRRWLSSLSCQIDLGLKKPGNPMKSWFLRLFGAKKNLFAYYSLPENLWKSIKCDLFFANWLEALCPWRIHGTNGIFTYIDPLKINHSCR